jgi:hypothetical protein
MVELLSKECPVFNSEASNFRLANNGQLFYSLIHAYDPREAIAEGRRIFMNHVKNSIL